MCTTIGFHEVLEDDLKRILTIHCLKRVRQLAWHLPLDGGLEEVLCTTDHHLEERRHASEALERWVLPLIQSRDE